MRERERSTRENSLKILKKLINFSSKTCHKILELKLEIFVSFFLERDCKADLIFKERLQCFKLILAWLEKDPESMPFLFGQTVATIAKNSEDK